MAKVIYDLRNDHKHIRDVQDATLHSSWAGLVPEHGLFGSEEWWTSINEGRIRLHVIRGRITRVYMSGHNDFPEFEVDDGKAKTKWVRVGTDSEYVDGRPVQIEYVQQRFKNEDKKLRKILGKYSECVLRISVETDSDT